MQFPGMPMNTGLQMMPMMQQGLNLMMSQLLSGPPLQRQLPFARESSLAETFTPQETGMQLLANGGINQKLQSNPTLLRAEAFTPLTDSDVAGTLTTLKLPVTKENLSFAKGMLEQGLNLTRESFKEMTEALAQLPKRLPSDLQSASFLKLSSLPLTPHNITNLSNFITTHPLIGMQLFEVQFEFRKLTGSSSRFSKDVTEMLSVVPGLLGEYILDGKEEMKGKNSKTFKKMAQQVGIEKMGEGWWQEDEMDLLKMLIVLRNRLQKERGVEEASLDRMILLLSQIEENISAQQLINKGKKHEGESFYYMQVPMQLDDKNLTAEVKIYYTTDYYENKKVDEENTVVEFSVTTEHLGELYFHLEIVHGIINVDVGAHNEEVRTFVEKYMPALLENVKKLLYRLGSSRCFVMAERPCEPLPMEVQNFEQLERINISC